MVVPAPGTKLKIKSIGTNSVYLGKRIKKVVLLGHKGKLDWTQEADGLTVTCPEKMPFQTSVVFKVEQY